jgi:tetratricopeptide (TPR) repeat protein
LGGPEPDEKDGDAGGGKGGAGLGAHQEHLREFATKMQRSNGGNSAGTGERMKLKTLILMLVVLAAQGPGFAQATKTGGASSSGGSTSSSPKPQPPGDPPKLMNRDGDKLHMAGRGGDRLTGNVTITGGAVPWDPIAITVRCDGKEKFTTTTDGKGFFAINSVDDRGPNTVKADPKPAGWQYLGCHVQAALPGFNSSTIVIANRNALDSTNIGTIKLSREENSGGSTVSSTTASAPKDASKAFEKARAAWLENKPDHAEKELQKAVQAYPQFAEAWYQLGRLQETANPGEAAKSFSKAATADPKYILPHEQLAILAVQGQKWQDVVDETKRIVELDPRGTAQIWYYSALGNFQLKNMDAAEAAATKALAMDPLHQQPNAEQLLAVLLANKQDFAGALAHLKNCLTYFPPGPDLELVKEQIAQIEPAVKPR